MPQVSFSRLVLLGLLVSSVFFVGLGSCRLWDRDEPRNARASHEMLARGDWTVPTFNGELRDHKPILLYWGQMLSYQAWGESEFTARLPSALCAWLTVLAVAVLASRLSGKPRGLSQEGFWAAGAMATCMLFVMAGRAATPDACLIAFSTLGIAALVIGSLQPSAPYSSGRVGKTRWLPALFGYTMLGLAALAKGPVGIILPMAVVHAWWMICQAQDARTANNNSSHLGSEPDSLNRSSSPRPGSPGKSGLSQFRLWIGTLLQDAWQAFNPLQVLRSALALRAIPGLVITLVAAAPWYIAVGIETNGDFLRGFFLDHNVGRALGSMEGHDGSLLFYPVAFLVGTFPWSMWLIPIVLWCRMASRQSVVHRQMIVLASVWIGVYVCAFSIASTKLPSYITPCYAGAALAIGGFWRQFENAWSRPSMLMRMTGYGLTTAVGVGILAVILWLTGEQSMPLLARAAACGIVIAGVGVLSVVWEFSAQPQRIPTTWLAGATLFNVLLFGVGAVSVDYYRQDLQMLVDLQTADSALEVQDSSAPSDDATAATKPLQVARQSQQPWISIGGMEPSWVYYLGQEIIEVRTGEQAEESWQKIASVLDRSPQARLIVVGDQALEGLHQWQASQSADAQTVAQSVASPSDRLPTRISAVQIAEAPRFLRTGNVRVFQLRKEFEQQPGYRTATSLISYELPQPTGNDSKADAKQPQTAVQIQIVKPQPTQTAQVQAAGLVFDPLDPPALREPGETDGVPRESTTENDAGNQEQSAEVGVEALNQFRQPATARKPTEHFNPLRP